LDVRHVKVSTPFGDPSDEIVTGILGDVPMAFLPRHGRGHRLLPSEINYRANVWALRSLGVDTVLSVSAVGSMREEIVPGHICVPHQFIDRTRGRVSSFFGAGCVAHAMFADPVCLSLARLVARCVREEGVACHEGGTYLCMEGPQFSTRAESNLYRSWGVSVIGMTNMPEAKLAREAELHYATIALSTDYDCWHETHEDVSVEAIVAVMKRNVENSKRIVARVARSIAAAEPCACEGSMRFAVITDPAAIPAPTRRALDLIVGRYLPPLPARKAARKPPKRAAKPAPKKAAKKAPKKAAKPAPKKAAKRPARR
jgi:5'-methylthioadenosine phosphorylase